MKLFAIYLGGRAPKCNTELHDVVFAAGHAIEDTYEQLLAQWFGDPQRLHLDSWRELDVIDGHRITLTTAKPAGANQLYFINLGAYRDGTFAEIHANAFIVAASAPAAKQRAKAECLRGWNGPVHTDDLYDIDDCIAIAQVNKLHIALNPTDAASQTRFANGYHPIPKTVIADYLRRNSGEKG